MLHLYRMPRKTNAMMSGFEMLLNDPRTNPFNGNGSAPIKEIFKAAEMPVSDALKYMGKKKKTPKVKEADIAKERVETLEAETTQ